MTVRSILLGLAGAVTVCALAFFNDMVIHSTFFIGNFAPISVFGGLIVFLLLVNPVCSLVAKRAPLTGGELAVIMALILFACYVPGQGLMHYFATLQMMPHHYARTEPGWQGTPARLEAEDVLDVPGLAAALTKEQKPGEGDPRRRVWQRLPPELRERLRGVSPAEARAPPDERAARKGAKDADLSELRLMLVVAMNALLEDPDLFEARELAAMSLPSHVRYFLARDPETLSRAEVLKLNRGILDVVLDGHLKRRAPGAYECVPPRMLADVSRKNHEGVSNPDREINAFVTGPDEGGQKVWPGDVPWRVWWRSLVFWIPLILAMCAAVTGLALVVHKQWARHESLPYPSVEFARSLLPAEGEAKGAIFRNRLFWMGAGFVLFIHMYNYACAWWPQYLVRIPVRFDFAPITELVPAFAKGPGWQQWQLSRPKIYFTMVGFAYFLTCDVSLSLGVAPYVYCLVAGIFAGYGINFASAGEGHLRAAISCFLNGGAWFAMFFVLVHTGRRYYLSVLRRSVGLRAQDEPEPHAVWGARVFFVGIAIFVAMLVSLGVDWQMAILYTAGAIVIFVVASRLVAEAGVIFLNAWFHPCALLWGFFGARALGVDQLLILQMVSSLVVINPRETLMPFVVSALALVDRTRGRVGRTASWGGVALLAGFGVALVATLCFTYQQGVFMAHDRWSTWDVPRFALTANSAARQLLESQGNVEVSNSLSSWSRFAEAAAKPSLVIAFAVTFAGVILFTVLRRRFAWWPLHPVMFLVLYSWQSTVLAFSFLLGWLIKRSVAKYGGSRGTQKLKALMIGLIAGDMLAGVIAMIIGFLYYRITGRPPIAYRIMPR
ncbi:MAG: DUF6785 family protein [Planctomycetota bacterium]|jgi:hypothetical protein